MRHQPLATARKPGSPMSRTLKDRPRWVRVNDTSELRHAVHRHSDSWVTRHGAVPCNIDVPETTNSNRNDGPCYFNLIEDFGRCPCGGHHRTVRSTHAARTRDNLGRLVREYNTFAEVEDSITNWDIRNNEIWYC
jgi:hypothetical protein